MNKKQVDIKITSKEIWRSNYFDIHLILPNNKSFTNGIVDIRDFLGVEEFTLWVKYDNVTYPTVIQHFGE